MDQARPLPSPPDLSHSEQTLGERLRAARLASGRSLAELAVQTRVQPRFLTAIEQGDQSVLPSRIFTMGYVRIYAQVLGLDELEAVAQFKHEFPEASVPLQAPTGAAFQEMRRRSSAFLGVLAFVVLAFLCWNIFQRLTRIEPPHPSDLVAVPQGWLKAADAVDDGPLTLGGPRAAPPDQSVPPLYLTRGIEAELLGDDPEALATANAPAPPVQAAFNPRGALYGVPATASVVVLQANKPASLVVRQGDGRILFARQLAPGDSWRAPMGVSATIDVSDPAAFHIYMNGEHSGVLAANQTQLGTLNNRASSLAREAEARAEARASAIRRERAAALMVPVPPVTEPSTAPAMTVRPAG